ncbi:uncharacterized protein LOC128559265 [Mercenaria mercenaria]|uniref:uncharacterized protein LOC128559265 n=1 Tax=Mercenaria mercenaria TaxID=6596 RepID=UPI00234E525B|nr:uncharacterized protein LOC128559265 [Mercenaria mercenaria]
MKVDKLRSLRDSQRKVIEIQLEKIQRAKENSSMLEFRTILESITNKVENLKSLNEKILEQTEITEIEEELISSEEFSLQIEIQLRQFREFDNFSNQERNNSSSSDQHQTVTFPSACSVHSAQYHRLPKLSLPTFDGNILQWQSFWDSFSTTVHTNPNLSDVQKFNYLRSQVDGDAARTIEGFALTNSNYVKAVELLQEQYGQAHKIVHAYMQALLQLPSPNNTLSSLRNYYDKLETYIRGLESLNQHQESYGTLLVPVVFDKLPAEIRKSLAREHKGSNLQLNELRKAIYEEINVMEAGQINSHSILENPATMSLLTSSGPKQGFQRNKDRKHSQQQQHSQQQDRRPSNQKVCVFAQVTHI